MVTLSERTLAGLRSLGRTPYMLATITPSQSSLSFLQYHLFPRSDLLISARHLFDLSLVSYGFASAPELYTGAPHQQEKLKKSFDRKVEYMRSIGVSLGGAFARLSLANS